MTRGDLYDAASIDRPGAEAVPGRGDWRGRCRRQFAACGKSRTHSAGALQSRPLTSRIERRSDNEGSQYRDQDLAQKNPEPSEDAAEVVSDGGEDGVCGVAGTAFEIAAAEVTFGFHVADHGLDGGAASQTG
jgi:hypothetical protein